MINSTLYFILTLEQKTPSRIFNIKHSYKDHLNKKHLH